VRAFYEGEESAIIVRSALWTYAIFNEFLSGNFGPDGPSKTPWPSASEYWYSLVTLFRAASRIPFAVGVFDPDFEQKGFGLIITGDPQLVTPGILGEIYFYQLGRSFKVLARSGVEDLHAPPSLVNASTACWANDNNRASQWGFLTCRHAVTGISQGATVALSGGGTAKLLRKAPPTVDAAYIGTSAPSTSVTPMKMVTFPTTGQPTDVQTSRGPQARSVVAVTNTLGVIGDPYHPIKVYLDQPCQPGDSGALVQASGGDGVGIYCGELSGATVGGKTGQTVGISQHLEQAVTVLDVSPHL
jgi:hypothetical protein